MTKEKLISDIELRLTKGKPSDDLELERSQIGHWLDVVRDMLVQQTLNKSITAKDYVHPMYIEKETCLAATMSSESCLTSANQKAELTLSKSPIVLLKDRGIVRVTTSDYQRVDKLDVASIDIINDLPFSKPNQNNLAFYREGDKIIIEGISQHNVDLTNFIVYYIPQYTTNPVSESDEFIIAGHLIPVLLDEVENIGRRQIYNSLEDDSNDGDQNLDINE